MSLLAYEKKRNLKKSGEPKATIKKSKSKIFVVQFHKSRTAHFDFRLELSGVLKSWAIPKIPPTSKNIKRLAIQVEDHPLGYEKFKGIIPEGNYGAGKVEIWDKGTYELKYQDSKKIEIILHGKKLKGHYILVKTSYGNKPDKSWLLFKI